MEQVLIIGGTSLLGKYLKKTAPDRYLVKGTYYSSPDEIADYYLDVTNLETFEDVYRDFVPDVVIHCSAEGNVDKAERDIGDVYNINVGGVKNSIEMAQKADAKFVFISSNAVYDGDNPPYSEISPQSPINNYGLMKAQGEIFTVAYKRGLIIRPYLLFGWPVENRRSNWVVTIVNKLQKGERLSLVNDTYWMPTYAKECALTIWSALDYPLIENSPRSLNIASPNRLTLYEFGLKVCTVFDLNPDMLTPASHRDFMTMSRRPIDTSYRLTKSLRLDYFPKSVDQGLWEMKDEIESV